MSSMIPRDRWLVQPGEFIFLIFYFFKYGVSAQDIKVAHGPRRKT